MDNVIFSGSSDGNWYNLFISNTALFQSLLSELHSDVGAYLVPVALFMYSSGSSCLCWSVFLQSFEAVQSIRIFNNFRIALISLEQLSSLFSCFCNVMQILGKPVLTVKFVLTGSTVFKLEFLPLLRFLRGKHSLGALIWIRHYCSWNVCQQEGTFYLPETLSFFFKQNICNNKDH